MAESDDTQAADMGELEECLSGLRGYLARSYVGNCHGCVPGGPADLCSNCRLSSYIAEFVRSYFEPYWERDPYVCAKAGFDIAIHLLARHPEYIVAMARMKAKHIEGPNIVPAWRDGIFKAVDSIVRELPLKGR